MTTNPPSTSAPIEKFDSPNAVVVTTIALPSGNGADASVKRWTVIVALPSKAESTPRERDSAGGEIHEANAGQAIASRIREIELATDRTSVGRESTPGHDIVTTIPCDDEPAVVRGCHERS